MTYGKHRLTRAICPSGALIGRPACRLTGGMVRPVPVLLALLAFAAPASANRFVVAHDGALPDVAVGADATSHVVWDVVDAKTGTSTTHYCRVERSASRCR